MADTPRGWMKVIADAVDPGNPGMRNDNEPGYLERIASGIGNLSPTAPGPTLDEIKALIPVPATTMPPGVKDDGQVGTADPYARSDHTHASKARKQIKMMSSAATTYTWTYPTPFAVSVVPIVSAIVQVAAGNTDLFNVQVMGVPTNTNCTFQINRASTGLLSLLTGALSINPTPVAATLHMIALEP